MQRVVFDQIHTPAKRQRVLELRSEVASETLRLLNRNPRLERCPACTEPEIARYVTRYGYALDRCRACGHVFTNPMPSQLQLEHYYNSELKCLENEIFSESFERRVPIFSYRIQRIHEYLREGTLLDVGSAIGIFVEAMRRSGTRLLLECCEASADACERLRHRYPEVALHACWLHEIQGNERYAAITLWDTLEHLVDLDALGRTVQRLLEPGGYWFFSTPNTRSFEWDIARESHPQLAPPGHVNLFNRDNIAVFLERLGFRLVSLETPNASLDVSYVQHLLGASDACDARVGTFLREHLDDERFASAMAELLVGVRMGGNLFVVAQRPPSV